MNGEETAARLSAAGAVRTLIDLQEDTAAEMTEVIADFLTYRKQEAQRHLHRRRPPGRAGHPDADLRRAGCRARRSATDAEHDGNGQKCCCATRWPAARIGRVTATYDVGAESIELVREPVTMIDDTGATLKGKRAFYDPGRASARLA